jgi:predicted nucleic acid-binding protein
VRAIVRPTEPTGVEWFRRVRYGRVRALAPDLVYAEAANAFAKYVQAQELEAEYGAKALRLIVELPLEITPLDDLAPEAFALAVARRISAYDACYLALSTAFGVALVTADRRLAALADESVLLPPA